ncbi:protocadherin beta-15-like isoform X1 [Octopus vulgaris]|uniref:Protocadherin beta-15-like isoform X1 n=2 Tax=Octopus vulgaris TaxID=6645 RepID=A0AA36BDH8_OCTVU|nr:protocadherin beta-15-like isoform X1 [Octopus vulgaris]
MTLSKKLLEIEVFILIYILNTSLGVVLTYHVQEEQNPGTYVGDIAANTKFVDSFPPQGHNLITFSQLHESLTGNAQLFNVSKIGKLYTGKTLDSESLCKYRRECFRMIEIAVRHEESFVKIIEIKIIVEDINDNEPIFPNKMINLQFDETDGKGTTKSIPSAVDKDVGILNSQITYVLQKDENAPFELSVLKRMVGTEKLDIVLKSKLDRETKDVYTIQVIAKDGGTPPREGILNVQISVTDVNDNAPIFSQNIYNVSVENANDIESPILILSAKDLDTDKNGAVSYYLNSETTDLAKSYFELNEVTGELFLSKKIPLKRRQTYKLYVEAKDGGEPSLNSIAMVYVNIINQQNNAPRIDVKFVSKSKDNSAVISEGVKVGSFIAYVKVTDNDAGLNGEVSCDLQNDKIQLQELGRKKYKVIVKNSVDRETEDYIDFSIICKDEGSPSLHTERRFSIQVMDVNDVQPQFTKDTFKFLTYENEKENFPVGYINATDPDLGQGGHLTYSLLHNHNDILPFQISDFGFISTTHSLDHEQQDIYEFNILVTDNGSPALNSTANVLVEVIDKNDNAPYFTFPSVNPFNIDVHYHPQSKNDVTTLRASDRDSHVNAFLRYEIIGGNHKQLFIINPYTGVLSFSRPVYQNDAGSYDLQFVVRDSGTPVLSATTTVFLTLTVSNSTSQLYTAQHTESDDMIHISLVVIIVIAAVIISTAIVVSIIVCIVQRQNQREVQYGYRIDANNDLVGERRHSEDICEQISLKYDAPVAMETNPSLSRNPHTSSVLKRGFYSGYKSGQNWRDSTLAIQLKSSADDTTQATMTSGVNKLEDCVIMAPDHCKEMLTVFSHINNGQNCLERNNGHYEELSGLKSSQLKELKCGDLKSLSQTLGKIKCTTSSKDSYLSDSGQNTPSNDVIDLKSFRVSSATNNTTTNNSNITTVPSETWNLPMRDCFMTYNKPLPAVPKISYS